jgi:hypothetical protein
MPGAWWFSQTVTTCWKQSLYSSVTAFPILPARAAPLAAMSLRPERRLIELHLRAV